MGIPALEDGLFANMLIFDYLYVFRYFFVKAREGKGKKEKGKRKKEKREGCRPLDPSLGRTDGRVGGDLIS